MRKGAVRTPKSVIIGKDNEFNPSREGFSFPVILKKPDSAFSIGVHKASDEESFHEISGRLFESSELIMLQEYIKSDFDWRVGVLGNEVIFACKYYMAENHWQIYNWEDAGKDSFSGGFETLDPTKIPEIVTRTALKATSFIGDGLYGVDLKEKDGLVYVIEVNDNPSIEYGIEDKFAGTGLYHRIIMNMFERIENSRNIRRFVSK